MEYDFYIGGEFRHNTQKYYSIQAPADSSELAQVPDADHEDVYEAVKAAKKAYYGTWKNILPEEKERLFLKMADILERRSGELGRILGLEGGKAASVCVADIVDYAGMIRFYAGLCTKLYGDVLNVRSDVLNYVVREPLGVVGCIASWNVPLTNAIQKILPALTAGNTVVLKAADEAPLATLMLGKVIHEAGFPAGVVNIICGLGPASGKALVSHPDVRLVSFTGSVGVGKQIMASAAEGMKRVILELGGKSPFIVFDDADIEKAARYAADFGFIYQGQLCCAASRILVHEKVKEHFLECYLNNIREFKLGYPEEMMHDPRVRIGPLFNKKQCLRVEEYVEIGKQEGKLLTGGNRITEGRFSKGYYFEPTVFEIPDYRARICREEIFGPVTVVLGFQDEEEAVRIANDVEYGLSSSVWTRDIGRIHRMTGSIEAGTVWVNSYMMFTNSSPWGGFKASGIGREYGIYAVVPFMDYKNIWLNQV